MNVRRVAVIVSAVLYSPPLSYVVLILLTAGNIGLIKIPPHLTGIFVQVGLAPASR